MNINKILDELPLVPLVIIATVFALMPFTPPHLWAKIVMLRDGVPLAPIDWFDLFVHGGPIVLASLRVWRHLKVQSEAASNTPENKDE